MAYITITDILEMYAANELIQLADHDCDGVADDDVVARAITRAEARIDALAARRYVVPLSPVPQMIKEVAVDLAIYYMAQGRGNAMPYEKQYEHAHSTLRDIAKGLIDLGLPSAGEQVAHATSPRADAWTGSRRVRPAKE